jgi:type VI secretion system protein VasD
MTQPRSHAHHSPSRWLARVLVLLLPLLAAACGLHVGVTSGAPRTLDLVVVGTPTLNRGEDGRTHPLIVRVYELSSTANFQRATPTALRENDDAALGAEYITKQILVLQPGAEQQLRLALNPETRFVGVAADFLQPDPQHWRQVHDASSRKKQLRVVLRENQLTFQ